MNGVEIANGYDELRHADEYRDVFEQETVKRAALKKYTPNLNKDFLQGLVKNPCLN